MQNYGIGKCANCGSDNINFQGQEIEDEYICFDFKCEDCGKEGSEVYFMDYCGTVINEKEGEK